MKKPSIAGAVGPKQVPAQFMLQLTLDFTIHSYQGCLHCSSNFNLQWHMRCTVQALQAGSSPRGSMMLPNLQYSTVQLLWGTSPSRGT